MSRQGLETVDLEVDLEENVLRLQAQIDAFKALPETARLSLANVTPDSVIVVEVNEVLDEEQCVRIRDGVSRLWPKNQVVVCERGTRLKICDGEAKP